MASDEQRRKMQERERLVENTRLRAARIIADAQAYAQSGNVTALERAVTTLQALLKSPELPRDLTVDFNRQMNKIQLAGYKYFIDDQLAQARRMAQGADEKRKQAYILKAREYVPKAIAAGAGEEFKMSVLKKIDIVEFTGNAPAPPQGTTAKPVEKGGPLTPNRAKF